MFSYYRKAITEYDFTEFLSYFQVSIYWRQYKLQRIQGNEYLHNQCAVLGIQQVSWWKKKKEKKKRQTLSVEDEQSRLG